MVPIARGAKPHSAERKNPRVSNDLRLDDESVVRLVAQRFWPLRNISATDISESKRPIDLDELEIVMNAVPDALPVPFTGAYSGRIGCRFPACR